VIQSSTTTTAIAVTAVGTRALSIQGAIPVVLGANGGTTVTTTLVALTFLRQREEFRRALGASSIHDFYNWLALLILVAVKYLGSLLKLLMVGRARDVLTRAVGRNQYLAMASGMGVTVLTQSSTITTSVLVPFAGAGILSPKQIYPVTVGANLGTTFTVVFAAFAPVGQDAQIGLQAAFGNVTERSHPDEARRRPRRQGLTVCSWSWPDHDGGKEDSASDAPARCAGVPSTSARGPSSPLHGKATDVGMDVFIIGITGRIGRLLAGELRDCDDTVRGLVRRGPDGADLAVDGIRTYVGDIATLTSPELADAVRGADVIVFTAGSNGGARNVTEAVDLHGVEKAVEAGRLAGVPRFALVSVFPEAWRERDLPEDEEYYFAAKKDAEVALTHSDLDWLVLRPSLLTDGPVTGRVSLGPAERHGQIGRRDVAVTLALLLHEPRIHRTILELNEGSTPTRSAIERCLRSVAD